VPGSDIDQIIDYPDHDSSQFLQSIKENSLRIPHLGNDHVLVPPSQCITIYPTADPSGHLV